MRKKFLTIIILGLLIPTILIGVILSIAYYRSIRARSYDIVNQNMETNIQVISERLHSYKDKFYEIVTNTEFIAKARELNDEDSSLKITAHKFMTDLFGAQIYSYPNLNTIVFLADEGDYALYSRSYGGSANSSGVFADEELRSTLTKQVTDTSNVTYFSPFNFNTDSETVKYRILMAYPVRKLRTGERYGVLLFVLEPEILLLESPDSSEDAAVVTLVTDRDEVIQASADESWINRKLNDIIQETYGSEKVIELFESEISGTGWNLISIVDQRTYFQEMFQQLRWLTAVVLIIIVVITFIVLKITNTYVKRIGTIADEISSYETGKIIKLSDRDRDELNTIVERFNQMSRRNQSLIAEMQRKNEEIVQITRKQRDAQIKALEAQINPHFLYNTLDSINWQAIENGEEEISNHISMLASLLRYSVSNIDMLVLLAAEIEWLKKYMFLQRDRFHNSFDWEYEVTEEAMNFPVYKMLLQPLMENSILHGFEGMKSGGMIRVSAFVRKDGKLEISVKDNGRGMDDSELERIREQIRHKTSLDARSIGISNVINRLWTYYGETAAIDVRSKTREGTEIILVIPEIKGKRYEDDRNS